MIDFLDRITLQPQPVRTSEIRCDTEQCQATIFVPNDIDEEQSAVIARGAGWTATLGRHRWYHACCRHAQVKR